MDIVREPIDGTAGFLGHNDNRPQRDTDWWSSYRDRVERAARDVGGR
ncbi:MAG: hypothetical protein L0K86_02250 [Actinomycetia bacterium]|nr:hypothetical protein [Actinomycetes bacterium]